jgi:transposase
MQPNPHRRVHGAELKAQVIAACREPGASVAAVALAHGLNANLVRKWLLGRGLKRAGLSTLAPVPGAVPKSAAPSAVSSTPLQFLPIDLAADVGAVAAPIPALSPGTAACVEPLIHIEASRGELRLNVRWPATHASACAALLRELLALPR